MNYFNQGILPYIAMVVFAIFSIWFSSKLSRTRKMEAFAEQAFEFVRCVITFPYLGNGKHTRRSWIWQRSMITTGFLGRASTRAGAERSTGTVKSSSRLDIA